MKVKIVSAILGVAILVLGVAIFRLHTKETVVPQITQPSVPAEKVHEPVPTPITEPEKVTLPEPEKVPFQLEIKQGFVIKKR